MKITPKKKESLKNELIELVPIKIISIINELLTLNFDARYNDIYIKERDIYNKCEDLDVNYEDYVKNRNGIILAYRKEGWEVKYDESYNRLIFS